MGGAVAFGARRGTEDHISARDAELLAVDEEVHQLFSGVFVHPRHTGAGDLHALGALLLGEMFIVDEPQNLIFVIAEDHGIVRRGNAYGKEFCKRRQCADASHFIGSCHGGHLWLLWSFLSLDFCFFLVYSIAQLWSYVNNKILYFLHFFVCGGNFHIFVLS